jgi:hypothetical protein
MKACWILAAALALSLTLGCERLAVIKKCRVLAERVNPELAAIEASVEEKQDAATFRAVSTRYAALAKELEGFDAGQAEANKAVADYAATLRTASRRVGELANAVANGNAEGANVLRRELEQDAKRQKNVAKRFQKECQGH